MYSEYIIVGLLIALIVALYIGQPTKMYGVIVNVVINNIRKNEPNIVMGLYNSLPKKMKEDISSEQIATIASYVLNVIVDILDETVPKNQVSAK